MSQQGQSEFGLGLVHVMQRISDRMRRDLTRVYKEAGIPFESRWYPVVLTLLNKGPMTVVEIADELAYAHPSVVNTVNELKKQKLVRSVTDKHDGRKKLLSLTDKSESIITQLKPVWKNIALVNAEISANGHNLFSALEATEKKLSETDYYERIKSKA